ncbi:hypothetical protein PV04_00643 [Phialophora macrospora]|uniref:N-acetyltransferase domain-containing protein n=1 Tax=Phialophora macrospora TaxID=1851006 RepID=A0A0D2EDT1_9EURO|nr:hypothetical protein PV04_00643 [Phialophora macrospora]
MATEPVASLVNNDVPSRPGNTAAPSTALNTMSTSTSTFTPTSTSMPAPTSTSTAISFTLSQSPEYSHRLAEIVSRATVTDPLDIIFQQEKTGPSTPVTPALLYLGAKRRVDAKIAAGAFVVEACNFAAVACWEPPASNPAPLSEEQLREVERETPVFGRFLRHVQAAETACFGAAAATSPPSPFHQPHWKLSLMARDPLRKDKGAVRAVIEPFVARAKAERLPLWLVAANARARDVYAYFGFRVVSVVWSYPYGRDGDVRSDRDGGIDGIPSWCMVCNWPVE